MSASLAIASILAIHLSGCGSPLAPEGSGATLVTASAPSGSLDENDDRPTTEPPPRIERPTLADLLAPGPLPERILGRPDAPVTLLYYSSLTCPYCRAFSEKGLPQLKREYIDTGKVRLIVREFPIGKTAGTATIATRCVKEARYHALHDRFLAEQRSWVSQEVRHDAIFEVARKEGLTRPEYDACLTNRQIVDGLKWVKERGRRLGVVGTPSFFVDDVRLKTNPSLQDIRQAIESALKRPSASRTGERAG